MTITIATRSDYLAIAREYAAEPDGWPLAPRFNPGQHWAFRLAAHGDAEVWLMTWMSGQGTDLHDHGDADSAFVVVSGDLTEYRVTHGAGGVQVASAVVAAGSGRRCAGRHLHRLANDGYRPAVSVHVYGGGRPEITNYRIDADGDVVARHS